MIKYIPLILIIISGLIFYSCSGSKSNIDSAKENFRKDALEKLGPGAVFLFNNSGDYVIAYKQNKPTPQNPMPPLRFLVYYAHGNSLIFEDSLPSGSVQWKNDTDVLVNFIPGNVTSTGEGNGGYIFDVMTKTKKVNTSNIKQE